MDSAGGSRTHQGAREAGESVGRDCKVFAGADRQRCEEPLEPSRHAEQPGAVTRLPQVQGPGLEGGPHLRTVLVRPGRLSALSVSHRELFLYGAFVWVCRALNIQKWWFPARADAERLRRGDLDTLEGCVPPLTTTVICIHPRAIAYANPAWHHTWRVGVRAPPAPGAFGTSCPTSLTVKLVGQPAPMLQVPRDYGTCVRVWRGAEMEACKGRLLF